MLLKVSNALRYPDATRCFGISITIRRQEHTATGACLPLSHNLFTLSRKENMTRLEPPYKDEKEICILTNYDLQYAACIDANSASNSVECNIPT